jgi:phage-related minor tail protein
MADPLEELNILLNLDNSPLFKGLDGATREIGAFSSKAVGLLSTGLIAGAAAAAAAVVGIGAAAISVASDFRSAQRDIQASLGATGDDAERLAGIANDVFVQGFGGSMEEATDTLIMVRQQMQGLAEEDLAQATKSALLLSEVFGDDLEKTTNAAGTLMKQFGLEGQQAFDFITAGYQQGADTSDDFLDTISEYSNQFASLGFTADEFFSTMQSGSQGGVLGLDKVADLVKEFGVRMQDGSDTTSEALEMLFATVGDGNTDIEGMRAALDNASAAVKKNQDAIEAAEGAYESSSQVVEDLTDKLDEARRELDELSRPRLAGMQEYDDQIFSLEQQANRARLSLLDLEQGTPQFENAQANLDRINEQIDRLALERDIEFEPQLRAIEQAAEEAAGTSGPLMTFDQAMAQIADKKTEISGLSAELENARAQAAADAAEVERLTAQHEDLVNTLENVKTEFADLTQPARDMLDAIASGEMTVADAFPQILDMLRQIEDPIKQNTIGVALFGTQWEDMTASGVLAIDTTLSSMEDMQGAAQQMEAATDNAGRTMSSAWRQIMDALRPLGEMLLNLVGVIFPVIAAAVPPIVAAIQGITGAIQSLFSGFGDGGIDMSWLQGLQAQIAGYMEWAEAAWVRLGDALSGPIQKLRDTVISLFENLFASLQNLFGAIMPVLSEFWAQHGQDIERTTQEFYTMIIEIITAALQLIEAIIIPVLNYIADYWEQHGDEIIATLKSAWDIISNVIMIALDVIKTIIQIALAIIQGDWEGAFNLFAEFSARTMQRILDIINDAVTLIINAFKSIVRGISNIGGMFLEAAQGIGKAIIDGIVGSITGGVGRVVDGLKNAVGSAVDGAKGLLGIQSPSTVAAEQIGKPIIEGVVGAIMRGVPSIEGAMGSMSNAIAASPPPPTPATASIATPAAMPAGGNTATMTINLNGEFRVDTEERQQDLIRQIEDVARRVIGAQVDDIFVRGIL